LKNEDQLRKKTPNQKNPQKTNKKDWNNTEKSSHHSVTVTASISGLCIHRNTNTLFNPQIFVVLNLVMSNTTDVLKLLDCLTGLLFWYNQLVGISGTELLHKIVSRFA